MSSKVEVLCPNGHRVNIKTTPNTKIVQILEEACNKKGFLPASDYELKHSSGRRTLDLTLTIQFAGLPNLAKLELVKAAKTRTVTSVTIALQLEDGQRYQADFDPGTTVWKILEHWQTEKSRNLTRAPEGQQLVCVYMREEVIGDYALKETTLHGLGLIGGRAILRLLHKPVDSSTLEAIKQSIDKEKGRQIALSAKGAELQRQESEEFNLKDTNSEPMETASASNLKSNINIPCNHGNDEMETKTNNKEDSRMSDDKQHEQELSEPMDVDDRTNIPKPTICSNNRQGQSGTIAKRPQPSQVVSSGPDTSIPGVQIFRPGEVALSPEQEQIAHQLAQAIMPGIFPQRSEAELQQLRQEREKRIQEKKQARAMQNVILQAPVFTEFKFPEETKGQDLFQNEMSEKDVEDFKSCERQPVLYSIEDIKTSSAVPVEPGEDFFELTEADVKRMWSDLQRNLVEMDDQPLMTQTLKKSHAESRLNKYGHVFIRFTFPNKLVLQGTFKPKETVYKLYKFVKENLEDENMPFYLYTSPPKHLLNDNAQTLIQARLVPMTVVYFGSEIREDCYLHPDVLNTKSSLSEASRIIVSHMPGDQSSASSSTSQGMKRPTTQTEGPSTSSHTKSTGGGGGGGNVPKWFKVGKK